MSAAITVKQDEKGAYEVIMDGRTTGDLCFGEMLEMVTKLLPPNMKKQYVMMTPEQWADRLNHPQPTITGAPK